MQLQLYISNSIFTSSSTLKLESKTEIVGQDIDIHIDIEE